MQVTFSSLSRFLMRNGNPKTLIVNDEDFNYIAGLFPAAYHVSPNRIMCGWTAIERAIPLEQVELLDISNSNLCAVLDA